MTVVCRLLPVLFIPLLAGCTSSLQAKPAPPPSPLLAWPARGELAHDQTFIAAATAAWDAGFQPHGPARPPIASVPPHSGPVKVLFAGALPTGRLAVLEGRNTSGAARLVVVSTPLADPTGEESKLELTNNVAAPAPAQTHALVLPRSLLDTGPGENRSLMYRHISVVALGEPGTNIGRSSLTYSASTSPTPSQNMPLLAGVAVLNLTATRPPDKDEWTGTATAVAARLVLLSDRERTYNVDLARTTNELAWASCPVCN